MNNMRQKLYVLGTVGLWILIVLAAYFSMSLYAYISLGQSLLLLYSAIFSVLSGLVILIVFIIVLKIRNRAYYHMANVSILTAAVALNTIGLLNLNSYIDEINKLDSQTLKLVIIITLVQIIYYGIMIAYKYRYMRKDQDYVQLSVAGAEIVLSIAIYSTLTLVALSFTNVIRF